MTCCYCADSVLSHDKKKIAVIIPARNESKFITNTIEGLKKQKLSPDRIIVVNDGSSDNTSDIAKQLQTEVVDLNDRGYRATGKPILAEVINKGLEKILHENYDYVMILGADHVISPDYILKIVDAMEQNELLAIASGVISGESEKDNSPRGSGRIVKYEFWKKLGLQYPLWYGFETYVVYKARIESYQVKVFQDATGWSQRPTGKTTDYTSYGKAMQALGYHPLYALGRIILTFKKNPLGSLRMFFGYLDITVKKYDIASEVSKLQWIDIKRMF